MKNDMNNKPSFLKNHADTLAIIGVNIGIASILLTMIILNVSRIDAMNAKSDALFQATTCRIDDINARSDALYQATTSRLDAMNARSDALYNIVYEMLKEEKRK